MYVQFNFSQIKLVSVMKNVAINIYVYMCGCDITLILDLKYEIKQNKEMIMKHYYLITAKLFVLYCKRLRKLK